jgi:O-acetyl-ADP-ribose deacetylase (regulator of RNase III)
MRIADEQGFASVAFPVIGAGSGRFDAETALELMLDEFQLIESSAAVTIVRYNKK